MLRRKAKRGDNGQQAALPVVVPLPLCPRCGVSTQAGDVFCAACGAPLASSIEEDLGEPHDDSLPAEGARPSVRRRPPRWALISTAVVIALVLAGAVSLLAFAWQTEQADRLVAEGQLASERARTAELTSQVGSLREDLSATEADLREAEDLAAARGQVLGQTRKVLKRVDPLLSSVDELQLLAGEIQDQRNAFGGDASLLIEELVSFANYILETDPFSYDIGYINTEIDYLNARLNDVRQASARLNSRDDDYRRASARFERRATSYSQSVRRLQRSLAEVTG